MTPLCESSVAICQSCPATPQSFQALVSISERVVRGGKTKSEMKRTWEERLRSQRTENGRRIKKKKRSEGFRVRGEGKGKLKTGGQIDMSR